MTPARKSSSVHEESRLLRIAKDWLPAIVVIFTLFGAGVAGLKTVEEIEARQQAADADREKIDRKIDNAIEQLRKDRREDRDLLVEIYSDVKWLKEERSSK